MTAARKVLLGCLFTFSLLFAQDADLSRHVDNNRSLMTDLAQPLPKQPKPFTADLDDDQSLSAQFASHQPPKAAKRAATQAEKLSRHGAHSKAIGLLQQALALDALFFQAENNLALEYLAVQQPDLAIEKLRHLAIVFPEHVVVANNLGSVLCQLKRYPEAETVARNSLLTHPFSYKANLILGFALVGQGTWSSEAKHSLEFASVAQPQAKPLLSIWPPKQGPAQQSLNRLSKHN